MKLYSLIKSNRETFILTSFYEHHDVCPGPNITPALLQIFSQLHWNPELNIGNTCRKNQTNSGREFKSSLWAFILLLLQWYDREFI